MDLHIHSKFSAATSKKMDLSHLARYGKQKGLDIIGTGDFTHPRWLQLLKEKLTRKSNGLYHYKGIHFLPATEVSTVYTHDGETKKIHHLLLAPHLEVATQIREKLERYGKLDEDGRPTLSLTSPELVEILLQCSPHCEVIPAHIWTPWYSLFGSRSGFDTIEECYQDMTSHIHAVETGLSSDPKMNWRLSFLDNLTLVSFSDAHSPWPFRIGREATVLDLQDLSYETILSTLREKDREKLLCTYEFFPEEGKYHLDGHRKCEVRLTPKQSLKWNNICPECGKKLTLGVSHRVKDLADRGRGESPPTPVPFKHTIPLQEVIAKTLGIKSLYSKNVWKTFNQLVERFKSEYNVMFQAQREELEETVSNQMVKAILNVRKENVKILPGYDGKYGEIAIFDEQKQQLESEEESSPKQSPLTEYF